MFVWIDIEFINPLGIEGRRASLYAMDDIALLEQKPCQMGTILTGDTGDQCDLRFQSLTLVRDQFTRESVVQAIDSN